MEGQSVPDGGAPFGSLVSVAILHVGLASSFLWGHLVSWEKAPSVLTCDWPGPEPVVCICFLMFWQQRRVRNLEFPPLHMTTFTTPSHFQPHVCPFFSSLLYLVSSTPELIWLKVPTNKPSQFTGEWAPSVRILSALSLWLHPPQYLMSLRADRFWWATRRLSSHPCPFWWQLGWTSWVLLCPLLLLQQVSVSQRLPQISFLLLCWCL